VAFPGKPRQKPSNSTSQPGEQSRGLGAHCGAGGEAALWYPQAGFLQHFRQGSGEMSDGEISEFADVTELLCVKKPHRRQEGILKPSD